MPIKSRPKCDNLWRDVDQLMGLRQSNILLELLCETIMKENAKHLFYFLKIKSGQ